MRQSDDKSNKRFFRADNRFFRVDTDWFYSTREGDEGPFKSEHEARQHLQRYIDLQNVRTEQSEKLEQMRQQKVAGDPTIWDKQIDII